MPEQVADGVALGAEDVVEVEVFEVDVEDEDVELGVGVIEVEAAGMHCESAVVAARISFSFFFSRILFAASQMRQHSQ